METSTKTKLRPKQLEELLAFCLENGFNILIKGKPGIGKTDIVKQSSARIGHRLIFSHPVLEDPTDKKGLPFVIDGKAVWVKFGDVALLEELPEERDARIRGEVFDTDQAWKDAIYAKDKEKIERYQPIDYFLDDLGQATATVQAVSMQLVYGGNIGGMYVSKRCRFIAATNRREDMAGVTGILEPVKGRFFIVELEPNVHDWIEWALDNNMPTDLISFMRTETRQVNGFKPTKDIENTPTPRNIARVGNAMRAGIPSGLEYAVYEAGCGDKFALMLKQYIDVKLSLPTPEQIILDPMNAPVPGSMGARFLISGMIAEYMTEENIEPSLQYLSRMPDEFETLTMKIVSQRNRSILATHEFIRWFDKNQDKMKG